MSTRAGGGRIPMKTTQSSRLSLLGAVALLTFGAPMAACAAENKPAACTDTTPHTIRFVTVAPGVELEVVDWGGSGATMVMLTGLGDNAHVYDQFAFQFTNFFRVIGITRRGYLPSSQPLPSSPPATGYDLPTRAADDIAVLDALGIDKAVFVGHSVAGGTSMSTTRRRSFGGCGSFWGYPRHRDVGLNRVPPQRDRVAVG